LQYLRLEWHIDNGMIKSATSLRVEPGCTLMPGLVDVGFGFIMAGVFELPTQSLGTKDKPVEVPL